MANETKLEGSAAPKFLCIVCEWHDPDLKAQCEKEEKKKKRNALSNKWLTSYKKLLESNLRRRHPSFVPLQMLKKWISPDPLIDENPFASMSIAEVYIIWRILLWSLLISEAHPYPQTANFVIWCLFSVSYNCPSGCILRNNRAALF